ncbi:MAG: copper homeostasis protein CutC [Planctomycetota bacterium]
MATAWQLEVCVEEIDHALVAIEAGATRIEFNSQLHEDGLTPDLRACELLVDESPVPIIAMLRCHNRGFQYSLSEKRQMLTDCQRLLDCGVQGIAVGASTKRGRLDCEFLDQVGQLCAGHELVLHRVVDTLGVYENWLIDAKQLGFRRVLTSGAQKCAIDGLDQLGQLVGEAGPELQVLVGGGVNADVIDSFLRRTKCLEFHGSFSLGAKRPNAREIHSAVSRIKSQFRDH